MAEQITEVRETRVRDDVPMRSSKDVVVHDEPAAAVARVIYFIVGTIIVLLAFRVLLSLLGANRGNPFADFIYTTSRPFVAPFFGLFNVTFQRGVARFEMETLFAMIVYGLIGAGLTSLLTTGQHHHHHYHYR